MNTVQVEYVGQKPIKHDNVAGTGIVWNGPGDVQTVPNEAWARMARHADVWRLKGEGARAAVKPVAAAPTPTPSTAPGRQAQAQGENDATGDGSSIFGTDHPAEIAVGDQLLPLGDVVSAAFSKSGLTIEQWNGLTDQDRHDFVEHHIELLRHEHAAKLEQQEAKATAPAKKAARKGGRGKAAG